MFFLFFLVLILWTANYHCVRDVNELFEYESLLKLWFYLKLMIYDMIDELGQCIGFVCPR